MPRSPRRRRRRLPEAPVQVAVDDLAHDGRGVGRLVDGEHAGKAVFVHGALPRETVSAKLIGRNRQFDEAVSVEVASASEDRVQPPCPFFDHCGGCALQHLSPKAQIRFKHKRLVDNFERLGEVTPARWAAPLQGPFWGYRRRARLSVRDVPGKGRVLVGFREPQGRYVADIGHCDVLDPAFAHRLSALSELVGGLSVRHAIPQIEIAAGDDSQAMIVRHLEPLSHDDVMALKHWSDDHGVAVYLQSKGPDTIQRLAPIEHVLHYQLDTHGLRLEFKPEHFLQVNRDINEQLIHQALTHLDLGPDDRVLDLFCGLGNFTLPMAQRAAQVTGVEGAQALVDQARHNALINGIGNTQFHVADLAEPAQSAAWANERYSHVLIDPPPSGAQAVLAAIAQTGANKLVYVSCNPATLARDAGALVHHHGFRLVEAGIADMFPHTAHVESIAFFERGQ